MRQNFNMNQNRNDDKIYDEEKGLINRNHYYQASQAGRSSISPSRKSSNRWLYVLLTLILLVLGPTIFYLTPTSKTDEDFNEIQSNDSKESSMTLMMEGQTISYSKEQEDIKATLSPDLFNINEKDAEEINLRNSIDENTINTDTITTTQPVENEQENRDDDANYGDDDDSGDNDDSYGDDDDNTVNTDASTTIEPVENEQENRDDDANYGDDDFGDDDDSYGDDDSGDDDDSYDDDDDNTVNTDASTTTETVENEQDNGDDNTSNTDTITTTESVENEQENGDDNTANTDASTTTEPVEKEQENGDDNTVNTDSITTTEIVEDKQDNGDDTAIKTGSSTFSEHIAKSEFVENIVFVKQTKVGGSTLKLALEHLAERHNLVMGIGKTKEKQSVNLSAHHAKFSDILQADIVKDPKRYIWLYREPTSKAASLFYWKQQEHIPSTINPEWKKMTKEDPDNLSPEHVDLLSLWAKQDKKTKKDLDDFVSKYGYDEDEKKTIKGLTKYRTQYSWIAETPEEAIKSVKEYDMLVGKTEDIRGSMLLFRKVLGWTIPDILYVDSNYYKHVKFEDWPIAVQSNMKETLENNGEMYFNAELNKIWDSQVEDLYGGQSIFEKDKEQFQKLRTLLIGKCAGGKSEAQKQAVAEGCKKDCNLYTEEYECMVETYESCVSQENVTDDFCHQVNQSVIELGGI